MQSCHNFFSSIRLAKSLQLRLVKIFNRCESRLEMRLKCSPRKDTLSNYKIMNPNLTLRLRNLAYIVGKSNRRILRNTMAIIILSSFWCLVPNKYDRDCFIMSKNKYDTEYYFSIFLLCLKESTALIWKETTLNLVNVNDEYTDSKKYLQTSLIIILIS